MQPSALCKHSNCTVTNPQGHRTRPTRPGLERCRRHQSATAFESRRHAGRRQAAPLAAEARDDEHPAAPPIAGIPVSVDQSTAVGERLWTALQRHPNEFVPLVIVELQQVWQCEHHEQLGNHLHDQLRVVVGMTCCLPPSWLQQCTTMLACRLHVYQAATCMSQPGPTRLSPVKCSRHVCLTRRGRLPQLADAERLGAEDGLGTDAGRVAAARRQAAREDVIYHWALAETYLQDPALQSSMRCVMKGRWPHRLSWADAALAVQYSTACLSSETTLGMHVCHVNHDAAGLSCPGCTHLPSDGGSQAAPYSYAEMQGCARAR